MLSCISSWDTYERREIDEQKHKIQLRKNIDFITNDDPRIEQKGCAALNSRRYSTSEISKNESNGGELSCCNLNSDEDISLRESDCEESEERVDIIDNIPCPHRYLTEAQNYDIRRQ
ncbi:hypothetical protein TNCV_3493111 [Trichonephila clavipes]|nr:hypothetical protein TNCV_3493111 [Trichonephila clavipes]